MSKVDIKDTISKDNDVYNVYQEMNISSIFYVIDNLDYFLLINYYFSSSTKLNDEFFQWENDVKQAYYKYALLLLMHFFFFL